MLGQKSYAACRPKPRTCKICCYPCPAVKHMSSAFASINNVTDMGEDPETLKKGN